MKAAPYPSRNTEELEAISTLEKLLNQKYAKPDIKRLDTRPNTDGTIELVDEEQRPIGKIEVQVRKIPDGQTSYQCPLGLVAYSENISLPFVLICVDVENNQAYFCHLHRGMVPPLKPDQQTFAVRFDPKIHSISNETQYLRQWTEITREYIKRVSDFPKLRQIEGRLNLSHISKEDRIYFQEFIERANQFLELDFPIVKDQFFKGVWKLGVAVSSADSAQVCFQIFSIFPGDPDIRVSGISEHPKKPAIVPDGAVSVWLQGTSGNNTIQYNWISRSILKSPSAQAEEFVLKYLTKALRAKSLPLFGERLAIEYLFWFVDNYSQSLGIEASDRLSVSQLNYGVFVFLPAWASLAVPRYLGEVFRLNKRDMSQMAHVVAAPPFEHVACVHPHDLRPTKAEVMGLIQSRHDLNPVNVRFTEASPQSLASAVDFLTATNVEWIDRPYTPKSDLGTRIWSGYSVEALRRNIPTILVDLLDDYRLFVQRNQIPLKNSFYMHQPLAKIYAADLASWTSSKDDEVVPTLKYYVVKNDDQKLPRFTFVDFSQFPNRLVVEKERLKLGNIEREMISRGESVAVDLFKDLPMLNQVYEMLREDLRGQYKAHRFL